MSENADLTAPISPDDEVKPYRPAYRFGFTVIACVLLIPPLIGECIWRYVRMGGELGRHGWVVQRTGMYDNPTNGYYIKHEGAVSERDALLLSRLKRPIVMELGGTGFDEASLGRICGSKNIREHLNQLLIRESEIKSLEPLRNLRLYKLTLAACPNVRSLDPLVGGGHWIVLEGMTGVAEIPNELRGFIEERK